MGDDVDIKVLKKTQDTLGTIIKKPPLLEKYLKKPPFRYLFDILINVNKATHFLDGLYTDEELVFENVKDKEKKIEFLQKAIDLVGWVSGEPLAAKASKIVAGHDPQRTNEFLQALGQAAIKKMGSKDAVKKVLAGEKPQKKSSSEPSNEKKNQQVEGKDPGSKGERAQKKSTELQNGKRNQQVVRNKIREDKGPQRMQRPEKRTSREVAQKEKGREDKAKEDKEEKLSSEEKGNDNKESTSSDQREKEPVKSLSTPSKDRRSSVTKASSPSTSNSKHGSSSLLKEKNSEEPHEKLTTSAAKQSPKSSPTLSPSKQTSGNKPSATERLSSAINSPVTGSHNYSPTLDHPQNSHQSREDSATSDHPKKSHQPHEGLASASSRPRNALSHGKEGQRMVHQPSTSMPPAESEIPDDDQRASVSRPPPPSTNSTEPSRPFSTAKQITSVSSPNKNAQEPAASFSQNSVPATSQSGSEQTGPPASARPRSGILRSARPASARLAPPKVKVRHRVENPEEDIRLNSAKTSVANVILDSSAGAGDDEDETDDTFLVEEDPLPRIPESNSEYGDADLESEGLLMKQILETKKMLEGGSQLPTEKKKTEIDKSELIEQSTGRELKELGMLRELIQAVSRRAAPLGRMLDYLQEDVDSMTSELTGWRTEHAQNLAMLQSQDKSTEALLAPLRTELEELDLAVHDQLEAISATRANILRNEQRISRMLASLRPS